VRGSEGLSECPNPLRLLSSKDQIAESMVRRREGLAGCLDCLSLLSGNYWNMGRWAQVSKVYCRPSWMSISRLSLWPGMEQITQTWDLERWWGRVRARLNVKTVRFLYGWEQITQTWELERWWGRVRARLNVKTVRFLYGWEQITQTWELERWWGRVRAWLNVQSGEGWVVEVQGSNQVQLLSHSNHCTNQCVHLHSQILEFF
jgi:hypothetical protein